ncbi:hypothetical protein ACLOJK_016688 [Asimina triloba]
MSVSVRSSNRLPISLRLEELTGGDRKGIGTILGFSSTADGRKATQITKSLRRTFSADMSSKKWLMQPMPGALKKTSSSQEFSEMCVPDSSSGSEGEDDEREEGTKEAERPAQSDIWNLIQSQKPAADTKSPLPPPYIHPLVKKSSNSLNKKSLEICTESLGSETGSDSFSPPASRREYITSDSSDEETEEEHAPIAVEKSPGAEKKESAEENYSRLMRSRKLPPRSFPPPLPSISRHDGLRLRMKPHRKNGRLVVEAISITCQNNFLADRQDGRLVLSFLNTPSTPTEANRSATKEEEEVEEEDEGKVIIEEVDKVTIKKEIVLEVKIVQEEVAAAVMKVHRPSLVMSKIVSEVVQLEERDALKRVPRAVPCAAAAAASFRGYNRAALFDDSHARSGPGKLVAKKKPVMVMKPEEFLPMMMRCVELSRPVLLWGPRCIATT